MTVLEYMQEHLLFLDGGMGTLLQSAGLKPGERSEAWNLSHPSEVTMIHKAYFDAGCDVVSVNTFGVNTLHYTEPELDRLVGAAFDCARQARPSYRPSWIAMDLGPTGKMLKPLGDLDFEEAVHIFAASVQAGVRHGADLILIETMNDSLETKAALLAAKENSTLPVFVSNAYGENGRLMTGASPAAMAAMLEGMGADAIGVNCSMGPETLKPVLREYLRCASIPVLFKPNAGLPRVENGNTFFDVQPEAFAQSVADMIREGVRIAGGCCGTTPDHLKALTHAAGKIVPVPIVKKEMTVVSSHMEAVTFGKEPLLIGERINPTGKKKLKQALMDGDIAYILEQGTDQEAKGVHILDVNVGLPEIDEADMLENIVRELQGLVSCPLQIDTANPIAMERALRIYNGKALINSVNGKQEVMDAIFPLVQKYGGILIALTLDENGIPETAQKRLDIAKRIIAEAAKYGINKNNLVFDTLTMTVSASPEAAIITLDAMERIRKELGCHTCLGVSNISFGLPDREGINSVFFGTALERGLSAAIMNPNSDVMLRVWRAFRVLHALDANCSDWVANAQAAPVLSASPADNEPDLRSAILKGLKQKAASLTRDMLSVHSGMEIINSHVIPALNSVGEGFEKQRIWLPQLLMSAEAASAAFTEVRAASVGQKDTNRGTVILATVKGDVHDIGKNIVRLLLENYGFTVEDLGRDVAPETVLDAIRVHRPLLVGLSALMTTTVPAMADTIARIHEVFPKIPICVGGAVLTEAYARKINADHYAPDAMDTVRYAESLIIKE